MKTFLALAFSLATLSAVAQTTAPPPASDTPPTTQQLERSAPAQDRDRDRDRERTALTDNQIADEVDARIAQLKAELRLTPEQDGNWSGLQRTLRDYGVATVKSRIDFETRMGRDRRGRRDRDMDDRRDDDRSSRGDRPDDIAQMRWEAEALALRAANLKKIADAAEPIYTTLNDRQKRILVRFLQRGLDRGR